MSSATPETDIEALLSTAPHQTPLNSKESLTQLRDIVAACVDMLPDEERFVIEALFIEGVSQRALANRMGFTYKSGIERIRDRGLGQLRQLLENDPTIIEKYGND